MEILINDDLDPSSSDESDNESDNVPDNESNDESEKLALFFKYYGFNSIWSKYGHKLLDP